MTTDALRAGLEKWREEGGEAERKTPWEKLREKPTRKTAIDAFCHHCMGWEEGGERPPGLTADIRDCTSTGCPLYMWRPYKPQT